MKQNKKILKTLFSLCVNGVLFLYLTLPAFGERGRFYTGCALAVLAAVTAVFAITRLGGRVRSVQGLLIDRLSGAAHLAVLLAFYLLCDACNLIYSPVRAQMLGGSFITIGGIVLWLGILFYTDCVDRLDNLLMTVTAAGLVLSGISLAGVRFSDARWALYAVMAGLAVGAVFLLSAQYRRLFKATVVPTLFAVMGTGLFFTASQAPLLSLAGGVTPAGRQMLVSSGFSLLLEFDSAEMILGRGSGYDIAVSRSMGVQNFLLADLLNGGILRFTLSLSLWLCIGYCVGMLFLYRRGVPMIYLLVFGMIFLDSFLFAKTGFLGNCVFIPFCALLIAEQTMLKKGRARFPGEESGAT